VHQGIVGRRLAPEARAEARGLHREQQSIQNPAASRRSIVTRQVSKIVTKS
jgi:hypothetical protein